MNSVKARYAIVLLSITFSAFYIGYSEYYRIKDGLAEKIHFFESVENGISTDYLLQKSENMVFFVVHPDKSLLDGDIPGYFIGTAMHALPLGSPFIFAFRIVDGIVVDKVTWIYGSDKREHDLREDSAASFALNSLSLNLFFLLLGGFVCVILDVWKRYRKVGLFEDLLWYYIYILVVYFSFFATTWYSNHFMSYSSTL